MEIYNYPNFREIAFVAHELVINAVEAMGKAQKSDKDKIQINFCHTDKEIKITVIDTAGGIPEEDWDDFLAMEMEEATFSDRGRGLFFIKHFVDKIWFDRLSGDQFLVGVCKKL